MCERQPVSRQRRWPDSIAEAKAGENRAFVRMLLARKQPEFARALADAEAEVNYAYLLATRQDKADEKLALKLAKHLDRGSRKARDVKALPGATCVTVSQGTHFGTREYIY